MLQLEGVSKSFGTVRAVDNLTLTINESENLVLLGTSGCGKTTTLRMLNRLLEPDSGTIHLNGQNIQEQPVEQLRRSMGYVLQHHGLFPHYTVEENIALVPGLLKQDKSITRKRVTELMEQLHLPLEYKSAYPGQLSGGQQQRVGLARALAADPPILLMDEPFGALDPVTRHTIRADFSQLEALSRKTIVMVTHDVSEAFLLADRLCLMHQGHIMQYGTPRELLFAPANDFVKTFLQAERMPLVYKLIRLQELWPWLPDGVLAGDSPVLTTDQSVWEALEKLGPGNENTMIVAQDINTGQVKKMQSADLMKAVSQLQSS